MRSMSPGLRKVGLLSGGGLSPIAGESAGLNGSWLVVPPVVGSGRSFWQSNWRFLGVMVD